jgi:hypothetical protein
LAAPPLIGPIHFGSMMLNQGSRLGYTVAMEHDQSYKLLFSHDEGRFTESDLAPLRNLVAAPFRLENSRMPEEVQRVLGALIDWLKAPEQGHLRRVFTAWLKQVFLPGRAPGIVFDGL